MQTPYQRIITRTRQVGPFAYQNEVVQSVRSCEFEVRRSGGRTWASLHLAREFRELDEFNWMDEYRIWFAPNDLRFVGRVAGVRRRTSGGEFEVILLSPVLCLEGVWPVFPSPAAASEHPSEADVSYWVRSLLNECLTAQGMPAFDPDAIPDCGVVIEMPILEGNWSLRTVLDVLAVMAGFWNWGVDLKDNVYFQPTPDSIQAQFHVGMERGWGKVVSLDDRYCPYETLTSIKVYGEVPVSLGENGQIVRPEHRTAFSKSFPDPTMTNTYGNNQRVVHVLMVRAEKQAAAYANACLTRVNATSHKYELHVSNALRPLDPACGLIMLHDEVGERLGELPAERIIFELGEDAHVHIHLGQPDLFTDNLSLLPHKAEKGVLPDETRILSSILDGEKAS